MRRKVLLKKRTAKPRKIQPLRQSPVPNYPNLWHYLKAHSEARVCYAQELCGLGDQIMILPTLREIKRQFPNCHLTLAYYRKGKGQAGDIYFQIAQHCAWVDEHLDIDQLRDSDFDYVVRAGSKFMDREVGGLKGRIDFFKEAAGLPHLENPIPVYHEAPEELRWAQTVKAGYSGRKIVALHVDSEEIRRSWPPEKYIELVQMAAADQPDTLFWVFDFNKRVKDWSAHNNVVDYSITSVREMASLIKQADVYVGPDSGPMHVAAAVGTKAVIIFGPIPHQARTEHYPTHVPIQSLHLDCCPCWYKHCPFELQCLKDIRVNDIFNQYTELL